MSIQVSGSITEAQVKSQAGLALDLVMPASPTADSLNAAVGKPSATEAVAVGTVESIIQYVKGLVRHLSMKATPRLASAVVTSGTVDLVNVSGRGILTGVTVETDGGTGGHSMILTINGTVVYNGIILRTAAVSQSRSISLPFNHRYTSSLRVQITNGGTGNGLLALATYTTE